MMNLTKQEKEMLEGKFGSGTAFCMKLLTELGDVMGAKRMITPASSHIVSFGYQFYGFVANCRDLDEEMLEGVTKFRILSTTNPKFFDTEDEKLIKKLGISDSTVEKIRESMTNRRFEALGAIPTYTCTPFFVHPTRKGESLAGAESVAIVMYNSIYGARVNRDTTPTALAAAITGKTPEFGMHKAENRYAQLQVDLSEDLKPEKFTSSDYSALGYYVGRIAGDRNVVFSNLPKDLSMGQLKNLLAPLGVSGAVMLGHVVGVTPEAPTLEAALLGREPEERILVGKGELEGVYQMLNTATEDKADLAVFGCPHAPLDEVIEIAKLLDGKRIRDDALLLIASAEPIKLFADRMGITGIVEKSGGLIVSDMCPHIFLWKQKDPDPVADIGRGINTIATDCTKCAHYLGAQGRKIMYGSPIDCINAVM
jgi:predicted aconitase